MKKNEELLRLTHLTIKKVTRDIEDEKFNTKPWLDDGMVGLYKIKESHELTCRRGMTALRKFDPDLFLPAYHRGIVAWNGSR